jgi:pimeloyl-ACP methyl ester carboxylesterase
MREKHMLLWKAASYKARRFFTALYFLLPMSAMDATIAQEAVWPDKVFYRHADVNGVSLFYRESGDRSRPTVVLLHGYPASSHSYRELIPLLSGRYHVIAPDNLGSGYSDKPDPETTNYSFDLLAKHTADLLKVLKIESYVLYMQDFGAPVGFRLMMMEPSRVKAIIAQNANAYLEGIGETRKQFFIQAQLDKSPENVAKLFAATGPDAIKNSQYRRDVKGREEIMSPDTWTYDSHFLETEKQRNIQVKLFQDYKSNLDAYPSWQELMKKHQFPALVVWGENDPVFIAKGAQAYLKDLPKAELHLLDAGHFAVEEKPVEIAKKVIQFLEKQRLK